MLSKLVQNNRIIGVVCVGVIIGLLLVGLWSLDFFPENAVRWLPDRAGLEFYGKKISPEYCAGGVALTEEAIALPLGSLSSKRAVSIEIWLNSSVEPACAHARIASFCDDAKSETLYVGQWGSGLLVRWQVSPPSGERSYRKIGVTGALPVGQTRFLTITSDEKGSAIYLEGNLVERFSHVNVLAHGNDVTGSSLRVGNSPDAKGPWFGKLYGLAIYDHSLTSEQVLDSYNWWIQGSRAGSLLKDIAVARYEFSERSGTWAKSSVGSANPLLIPSRLPFEKRVLAPPDFARRIGMSGIKDIVINVAGFVPFGFLFSLWLRRLRKWSPLFSGFMVVLLGVCVSLTIELLQAYIPVRDSSQTDLIFNTLGITSVRLIIK